MQVLGTERVILALRLPIPANANESAHQIRESREAIPPALILRLPRLDLPTGQSRCLGDDCLDVWHLVELVPQECWLIQSLGESHIEAIKPIGKRQGEDVEGEEGNAELLATVALEGVPVSLVLSLTGSRHTQHVTEMLGSLNLDGDLMLWAPQIELELVAGGWVTQPVKPKALVPDSLGKQGGQRSVRERFVRTGHLFAYTPREVSRSSEFDVEEPVDLPLLDCEVVVHGDSIK
jgi:hypothetical protein